MNVHTRIKLTDLLTPFPCGGAYSVELALISPSCDAGSGLERKCNSLNAATSAVHQRLRVRRSDASWSSASAVARCCPDYWRVLLTCHLLASIIEDSLVTDADTSGFIPVQPEAAIRDPDAMSRIAFAAEQSGDPASALAFYRRAIELQPNSIAGRIGAARALAAQSPPTRLSVRCGLRMRLSSPLS